MLILNLILDAVVIWVGSILSPETIIFEDTKALIITTLILLATNFVVSFVSAFIAMLTTIPLGILAAKVPSLTILTKVILVIISIITFLFANYMSLSLVNTYYDGFTITNNTHMFLLSLALSFTGISQPKNEN